MTKTARVFWAIFLGVIIGSGIAESWQGYWWVGVIVGAVFAGLMLVGKQLFQAVPAAWKKAVSAQPDKERRSAYWRCFAYGWVFSTGIFFPIGAIFGFYIASMPRINDAIGPMHFSLLVYFLFVAFGTIIVPLDDARDILLKKSHEERQKEFENSYRDAIKYNALTVIFYHPWRLLWQGIVWMIHRLVPTVKNCWQSVGFAARVVKAFVAHWFRAVYSDPALLCGIITAAFVGLNQWLQPTLVGTVVLGVVGGLFGALNYEVVSKRWLKLVPMHDAH